MTTPALLATPRPDLLIGQGQSEYLDVIRGVAAQLVLVQHLFTYSFAGSGLDQHGVGAVGVLAFFLLSGFLITDSVAGRVGAGRFSVAEFTVARFSRIYTPYVPAIVLVAVLDWSSSHTASYAFAHDFNLHTALANVAMLQDFPLFQVLRRLGVPDQAWFIKSFGSGRQFWTVSIEWWIYVAVGCGTAVALGRRSPLLLATLAFASIETLYNLVGGPGDSLTLYWLLGAGAALTYRRFGRRIPARSAWCGLSVVVVLAGTRYFFTHGRVYDPVFALLVAAVLFTPMLVRPAAVATPATTLLRRLRLDRLSFNSYSLYLTHTSVVVWLVALHPGWVAGPGGFVLTIAITNALAVVFAAMFELPHRRVRAWLLTRLGPTSRPLPLQRTPA